MKGFRFYVDIPGTKYEPRPYFAPRGKVRSDMTVTGFQVLSDQGFNVNCIAVFIGNEYRCPNGAQECIASVFDYPNSGVATTSISRDMLRNCRRISESLARKLHPQLFALLDMPD